MSGVDFTDKFFQQTLEKISVNNSLFFTPRQFYYFFNQRRNLKKPDPLTVASALAIPGSFVLMIVLSILFGFSWVWLALFIIVTICALAVLVSPNLRKSLRGTRRKELNATPSEVEAWYRRWVKINGDPGKLLTPPAIASKANAPSTVISPELKNYSFDRAVICERAELAQCLIANNFHFENNSAVLSLDGYPYDIFNDVMDMLRRNPDLSVYALHDASKKGIELSHILSTDNRWFAGSQVKILDLGLLPRQILDRSVFVEQSSAVRHELPDAVARTLQPQELSWLNAGNSVSVESFPPLTLLRVISQGIAKSRDPKATDALVPVYAGSDVTGVYYYSSDSFG